MRPFCYHCCTFAAAAVISCSTGSCVVPPDACCSQPVGPKRRLGGPGCAPLVGSREESFEKAALGGPNGSAEDVSVSQSPGSTPAHLMSAPSRVSMPQPERCTWARAAHRQATRPADWTAPGQQTSLHLWQLQQMGSSGALSAANVAQLVGSSHLGDEFSVWPCRVRPPPAQGVAAKLSGPKPPCVMRPAALLCFTPHLMSAGRGQQHRPRLP